MPQSATSQALGSGWAPAGAILGVGAVLWWLSAFRPSLTPVWAPWDFSWPEYLAVASALLWYGRGLALAPVEDRPAAWRTICFVAGLAAIQIALQTRFEFLAQHMFFLNRIQHVATHHLGPFLIALSWPGATLERGMPGGLVRMLSARPLTAALNVIQQPVPAGLLFVGLYFLWLVPEIHFRAMLDPRLYAIMNWSMVVDGILFWVLVLDPRSYPAARLSFWIRGALALAVDLPQTCGGALIAFSPRDLYPVYDVCGRLFPSLGPLDDQVLGGLISWMPPTMMSMAAVLLVVNAVRLNERPLPVVPRSAA